MIADRCALVTTQYRLAGIGCRLNTALRALRRMRREIRTESTMSTAELDDAVRRLTAVQDEVRDAINAIDDHASEPVGTQTLLAIA